MGEQPQLPNMPAWEPLDAPGGERAVERGCLCPVMDNGFGYGTRRRDGDYIIVMDCPVHVLPRKEGEE